MREAGVEGSLLHVFKAILCFYLCTFDINKGVFSLLISYVSIKVLFSLVGKNIVVFLFWEVIV